MKLTEKINPKNGSVRVDHIITVTKIRSDFYFYSVPRSKYRAYLVIRYHLPRIRTWLSLEDLVLIFANMK